jgi:hypothetical protein
MEKIHEFLRPDTWSLLLLDQAKQELGGRQRSRGGQDIRIKLERSAGWSRRTTKPWLCPTYEGHAFLPGR